MGSKQRQDPVFYEVLQRYGFHQNTANEKH